MENSEHIVEILEIRQITHNVRSLKVQKPEGYSFEPGQATEVSINKPEWKDEKRPFTFTSLNIDPVLEFTIKIYREHEGVTEQIEKLNPGDELIIRDVWGTIQYKGPGYFIAGGAGVTPFISILRKLRRDKKLEDNCLIYSNRKKRDVIHNDEFVEMLGTRFISTLTDEDSRKGYHYNQRIDEEFLREHIDKMDREFYICGPEQMVEDISAILKKLGADPNSLVFEE
jgi:ferredoxin-NADP reductase